MAEEYKRVKEAIAKLTGEDYFTDRDWEDYSQGAKDIFYKGADQILSLDGIEIRADDQTIVIPCYQDGDTEKCTYINAEPPSWIKDAGFVKVIPKGR